MSSMSFCHSCKAETKYICLICHPSECAVFLTEETPHWKSGSVVSCNRGSTLKPTANDTTKQDVHVPMIAPQTSNDQSARTKPRKKASQTTGAEETAKRNCLSFKQRVEMINYAKNHPKEDYCKVAKKFGIGRMQAQKILKEKEVILTEYENNMQSCKKRVRSAKYSDVNEALWEWYTHCRESNIPDDSTVLQEEALLIAEKLGISGFTASNGWLQRFQQRYNFQKMANAGEDGDVSEEMLESWNERVREITQGWSPENVCNMDEAGSFWRGLPDTSLNKKGR